VAFESNFAEGAELGAAFAAYVDGECVVDVWGGLADRQTATPWIASTIVGIFSGTKGLTATCMAVLIDRGKLELSAAVSEYWPEFAAEGKGDILVSDVLTHQARLPGVLTPVSVEEATDDLRMARLLAEQRPLDPRDTGPRYHALTFGWLCGELVRRVDGRSIGRFLRDEIADPLGLEVWIGLPESEEHRVALLEPTESFAAEQSDALVEREADEVTWSIWSNPPRFAPSGLAANLRSWHAAEVPASNGVVAARSMARLYGCLAAGGELDGTQLISPATLAQVTRQHVARIDAGLKEEFAFGIGFEIQITPPPLGPPGDAFGHSGAGGSVHGAWPTLRTGFSYTPNLLGGSPDPRGRRVLDALHKAVVRRRRSGDGAEP
jgi:CubicO group peptidase (beta-lactamase class C family)